MKVHELSRPRSALGQAVKFVHWQERPMLRSRAEVRPQPGRAIAAISLDGCFIAISSFGDWSKLPFRTRRRMDGRTILRCCRPKRDPRQFGRTPEPKGKARPKCRAVVDVERHATNRVSSRDEAVVGARHQPVQSWDHATVGMPRELQRYTTCGRLRGIPRLVVEQDDRRSGRRARKSGRQIRCRMEGSRR